MNSNFEPILREIDFLLAEAATLREVGPRIQVRYRFHRNGIEVIAASLVNRSRAHHLRLSPRALVLLHYLTKNRIPQSAAHIQTAVRDHSYVIDAGGKRRQVARLSHVKVYIKRIREALAQAFRDAEMDSVDPSRVLISEAANGNSVLYSLRCSVEWLHETFPQ